MNDTNKYRLARFLQRAPITYPVRNRIFSLLKRWITFDVVKRYPGGLQLCVDLTDYIGYRIWERGVWEKRILALVRDLLRNGGVFVEVGMHCGFFATSIAHAQRERVRVIGFEPNERIARLARKNVLLNDLSNLTVDPRALSDRKGPVMIYVEPEGNSGQTGFLRRLGASRPVTVQAITLAEALDEYHLGQVTLLKLDVEGAEALILPDIEPLLKSGRISALLVEMHEVAETGFGVPLASLLQVILRSGMVVYHFNAEGTLVELKSNASEKAVLQGHLLALQPGMAVPFEQSAAG